MDIFVKSINYYSSEEIKDLALATTTKDLIKQSSLNLCENLAFLCDNHSNSNICLRNMN